MVTNEYSGWIPSKDEGELDRVDPDSITAEEFFEKYVSQRKPCILTKTKLRGSQLEKWTNFGYLRDKVGDLEVQIEQKVNGQFGSGLKRRSLPFGEFLGLLEENDDNWYMTTQYGAEEDDGKDQRINDYIQPPLTALTDDFPVYPDLLPTLIPQQVNLWMGANKKESGTTTGLHVDFADNLYVLLNGRKQFTLFPPADAERMHLHGDIDKVYSNGLIVFRSPDNIVPRSDGAFPLHVARWRLDKATQSHLIAQDEHDDAKIAATDEEIEKALEEMLQYEIFGNEDEEDWVDVSDSEADKKQEPLHFSKIPYTVLHNKKKKSPFKNVHKARRVTCSLEPGNMLYLPAGWFHEVSSIGEVPKEDGPSYHMAFNYWFYPPSKNDFSHPYEDDYWKDQWETLVDYMAEKDMPLAKKLKKNPEKNGQ